MARARTVSPDRIVAVAALEFAERGFAGARVDRIARRARVNKAMLYYHFGSKQALYRTLLRQMFAGAAERLRAIAISEGPAADKVEQVIAAMGGFIAEHAVFPAIMMREVAEGGVHLDRETLEVLASVPRAFGGIVQQGIADGELRHIHPITAYFTMLAPVVMYFAGAPIRKELTARHLIDMTSLPPDVFVRQHQESVRLAFTRSAGRSPRRRSSHSAPRTKL